MDLFEDLQTNFRASTPSFCIIAPTEYLSDYATKSTSHLVLAHLVQQDDKYADFYADMSERGDWVMLDNGAYELGESYDPDSLLMLAKLCGAHAIVLPDYPFRPAQVTINAAEERIEIFKDAGYRTFFVPQSEQDDMEDWIEAYQWAAEHPDIDIIGMSILGIPNAISHIPAAYARVVMTQILIDRGVFNFDKYHHYLGLNAGPALEIPSLIKMGALHSCDSSGPVWAGIQGHLYSQNTDSYMISSKVPSPVDFDFPMINKKTIHNYIQWNLDLTLELFNEDR